jgi:hypothetical protein
MTPGIDLLAQRFGLEVANADHERDELCQMVDAR